MYVPLCTQQRWLFISYRKSHCKYTAHTIIPFVFQRLQQKQKWFSFVQRNQKQFFRLAGVTRCNIINTKWNPRWTRNAFNATNASSSGKFFRKIDSNLQSDSQTKSMSYSVFGSQLLTIEKCVMCNYVLCSRRMAYVAWTVLQVDTDRCVYHCGRSMVFDW